MRLLRSWYYQHRSGVLLRRINKLLALYQGAIAAENSWKQGYVSAQINEADFALSALLDRWDATLAKRRRAKQQRGAA